MGRLLVLVLFFTPFLLAAQSREELWEAAANAYRQGEFREAAELYAKIESEGYRSAELYYNLGNSYYRLNNIPGAVLNYEKALQIDPKNGDVRNNLKLANSHRENAVVPVREFFLVRWITSLAASLSATLWGIVFIALLWLTIWLSLRVKAAKRRYNVTMAVVAGVLCLLSGILGYARYTAMHDKTHGIVMEDTDLLVAPDAESRVERPVEAAEKVLILDSLDGYYKLRLLNYEDGWVEKRLVERI